MGPFQTGVQLTEEVLQGPLRTLAGRQAQLGARLRVARALLPAPPDSLVPALLFLTQDPDLDVKKAARDSLVQMPGEVLLPVIQGFKDPQVLDATGRALAKLDSAALEVVLNNHTNDDTVRWLATMAGSVVCDTIARNQVRAMRCPAIIEAIYFNPAAAQGVVQSMLELAVRSNLPLDHIPGFRETRAILLGEEVDDSGGGLSDIEFASAMLIATGQADLAAALLGELPDEVRALIEEKVIKSLGALIARMSVSQKIRIAMVGDAMTRKLLIRDPKKIVSMAVLKSPRLSDNEITVFAGNKTLSEDLLSNIARNRQWTKDYATRRALVFNPKCPIVFALMYLRGLTSKDIKLCANSRDVSQTVSRQAKHMIDAAQRR